MVQTSDSKNKNQPVTCYSHANEPIHCRRTEPWRLYIGESP